MLFSIIVPAYNLSAWLDRALESARAQNIAPQAFEIIVVDDCSTDDTFSLANNAAAREPRLRVLKTSANGGPGAARNLGVANARGAWIVFLDGDDRLAPDALARLAERIGAADGAELDLVGYDWRDETGGGGRKDAASLAKPKAELLRDALALKTDGSVIYTAMRRAMLEAHAMAFAPGLHEDVDFIFAAYCAARRIAWLDRPLYEKSARAGSIVHCISERHIDGFVRACAAMSEILRHKHTAQLGEDWGAFELARLQGWVALIATRVRALRLLDAPPARAAQLLTRLGAALTIHGVDIQGVALSVRTSNYFRIAERFTALFEARGAISETDALALFAIVDELAGASFSCTDLHHSVFLRADEVRTCCKRFFVDGEMRGDIVLLDKPEARQFSAEAILAAKRALHDKINRGEPSGCEGCPFLELKAWDSLERLSVKYLSLEHHSVCNLQCAYCSEDYYGGARARYDVGALVGEFGAAGALDACEGIVWGGGEPTIDAAFTPLALSLEQRAPNVRQRILTNAVAKNETVEALLRRGRAVAVTSVDAGTEAVFEAVRGKPRLSRVLANLRRMAEARAANVTVKYIFTDGNSAVEEALAFVEAAEAHNLLGCNFQLSSDFKKDGVPFAALCAMAALYGALERKGARLVFVDDLVRQRFTALDEADRAELAERLEEHDLGAALADARAYASVAIWGAGWQAKFLIERARFFASVNAPFFVDATPAKIGARFLDRDVRAPEALRDLDVPVVIAAAQAYPAIYQSFLDLGLDRARLVRGLII
jgi:glycosyltransferase involved in cell wall biosynthesis